MSREHRLLGGTAPWALCWRYRGRYVGGTVWLYWRYRVVILAVGLQQMRHRMRHKRDGTRMTPAITPFHNHSLCRQNNFCTMSDAVVTTTEVDPVANATGEPVANATADPVANATVELAVRMHRIPCRGHATSTAALLYSFDRVPTHHVAAYSRPRMHTRHCATLACDAHTACVHVPLTHRWFSLCAFFSHAYTSSLTGGRDSEGD